MDEAKDYKKYLKSLKNIREDVVGKKLNTPEYNIMTYDQKSFEAAGGKGKAVFKDYKKLGVKNEDEYFKLKNKAKSVMTKAAKRSPAGRAVSAILKGGSYIKDLIK
jgi:hypothetical protein|tara:strand:- start:93 stop:410 length:318 start_codon:yes stop_codon:yes gene_type:complete